jgi:hypothetical protein
MGPDSAAMNNCGAESQNAEFPQTHVTAGSRSRPDAAEPLNSVVMVDRRICIDYAVLADACIGVYDCPRHHDGSRADRYSPPYLSRWVDSGDEIEVRRNRSDLLDHTVTTEVVTDRNYTCGGAMFICQSWNIPLSSEYPVTEDFPARFDVTVDDTHDAIDALFVDNIEHHARVAGAAYEEYSSHGIRAWSRDLPG